MEETREAECYSREQQQLYEHGKSQNSASLYNNCGT